MGVTRATLALLFATGSLSSTRAAVLAVYESGVEAYTETLEGLKTGFGTEALRLVDARAPSSGALVSRAVGAGDVRLVVAIGGTALASVQGHTGSVPVIATMVLQGAGPEAAAAYVELELPLSTQLVALRALLPQRTRVGIIRNPARAAASADALEKYARREGFSPTVVDCDGPARLLKALASLKGKVDFLICFPDSDLYNTVTIKPLIMASLEERLPLVGFSPAFVRAGAAVGIYPDYRATGSQTAELGLRLLQGGSADLREHPRRTRIAVNQRVARLLGIDFQTNKAVEVFK